VQEEVLNEHVQQACVHMPVVKVCIALLSL
jgi:hypothetical protein